MFSQRHCNFWSDTRCFPCDIAMFSKIIKSFQVKPVMLSTRNFNVIKSNQCFLLRNVMLNRNTPLSYSSHLIIFGTWFQTFHQCCQKVLSVFYWKMLNRIYFRFWCYPFINFGSRSSHKLSISAVKSIQWFLLIAMLEPDIFYNLIFPIYNFSFIIFFTNS